MKSRSSAVRTGRFGKKTARSAPLRRALGIDIGQHAIKAVLLESTVADLANGGPLAVRYCAKFRVPAGAVQKGVVVRQREVATLLRQILREIAVALPDGGKIDVASLSVSTEQALARWIDLPVMDNAALLAAARFEARKYLPYPIDQAELSVLPSPPPSASSSPSVPPKTGDEPAVDPSVSSESGDNASSSSPGTQRALLVAAPREGLRSRAEALEMAGIEVGVVELETFPLLRAIQHAEHDDALARTSEPIACLHIGEESSAFCVSVASSAASESSETLRFLRTISWGGARLTQALAAAVPGGDLDRARELKEQPDAFVDTQGVFFWESGTGFGRKTHQTDALCAELDRLTRELQRLLNYYRSLYPEHSYEGVLNRVVLSGGTANLNGLDLYLSERIAVAVAVRDLFPPVPESYDFVSMAARGSDASPGRSSRRHEFAVALGLAFGEFDMLEQALTTGIAARPPRTEYVWHRERQPGATARSAIDASIVVGAPASEAR